MTVFSIMASCICCLNTLPFFDDETCLPQNHYRSLSTLCGEVMSSNYCLSNKVISEKSDEMTAFTLLFLVSESFCSVVFLFFPRQVFMFLHPQPAVIYWTCNSEQITPHVRQCLRSSARNLCM